MELCHECEEKDILSAHKLMLNDEEVNEYIFKEIDEGEDLLKAIKNVQRVYFDQFSAMEDEVFSSKALDVEEVFDRLINNIKKQDKFKTINKNFILICDELLPTTIYDYPLEYLKGIVVKKGTFFSHGVIIAKSKQIPVVIGLGLDTVKIKPNDYLVVDGLSGKVVLISE
jgi:phosphoenolpyruvate-protein kinase (PTS system EI component)